jgi:putative nucleotidyltransferase with HDIG domain
MRRQLAPRWSELGRSLTVLRTFLITSAVILAAGAFALSSTLSGDLRDAALDDTALDIAGYVDAVVAPAIVERQAVVVVPRTARRLRSSVRLPGEVRGLTVYARGGRIAFSLTQPGRVGRLRQNTQLRTVLRSNQPRAELVSAIGSAPGSVKVWAPLHSSTGRTVGAAEVVLADSVVTSVADETRATVWYAVAIVFGLIWLVLALLVRGASARFRRQNEDLATRSQELLESSKELEATLLETIETLNAAVEARDPYTAGHSQRVRRVALAIGRELRLPAKQLGALATAALFHDIGKIGMPDSILTKPDKLDRAEAVVMREHVVRGAQIVSRITSLRECVPAILHHHERWDGLGYPDRLSETNIPVEAAIIAIADAWDAMTTDRPYATALSSDEAMMQIRSGRGKQFSPIVVDAFWAVVRRRPGDVLPSEAPEAPEKRQRPEEEAVAV